MSYEKYLISEEYHIDEAMSPEKALKKLKDKIKNATGPVEVRLAGQMLIKFIKTFGKTPVWDEKTAQEVTSMLASKKKSVA